MGTTIYRVTGIVLSLSVAALGAAVSGLLFYAGTEVLNKNITFLDELHQERRYMPIDDWYDDILQNGWMLGFVYVLPGLIGFTASLFLMRCLMVLHVSVSVFLLIFGSFLHSAFAMAVIFFWALTSQGVINYDEWFYDCIYIRYRHGQEKEKIHECETGRTAVYLGIAIAGVCFIAWVILLFHLLFVGFTFHNIGKKDKKPGVIIQQTHMEQIRQPDDRPRRRPYPKRKREPDAPQASSTTEAEINFGQNTRCKNVDSQHSTPTQPISTLSTPVTSTTKAEISTGQSSVYGNIDSQDPPQTQTTPAFSTFKKSKTKSPTLSAKEYINKAYDTADETDRSNSNTEIDSNEPVSTEMVEIDEDKTDV